MRSSLTRTAKTLAVLTAVLSSLTPPASVGQSVAEEPAPASAEQAQKEVVALPELTVVGSYLKRTDVEKVLPVTVISPREMEVRGATQPAELLTMLPEVTGLPLNEAAYAGATARGDNAAIALRDLPGRNTLVLLNGRRLVPHPIHARAVNVNQLPLRGLERVEVLRDGGSSLYGTDAVAGVVNHVTRTNLRGSELSLRFSETTYRDGMEVGATLTHGLAFSRRRGRAVFTADFYHRQALYARDRPFGADADNSWRAPAPWNVPTNTTFNLRSTSSEYGSFQLGTVTGTDAYGTPLFTASRPNGIPPTLVAASGTFYITPLANGGVGIAPAAPARTATGPGHDYYWNNSAYRVIQPQSTRLNLLASLEYDLNDRLTAFADLSLYQAHSITYREPDTYAQGSTDGYLIVPATNPFNPFGDRFWSPTGAPNADGTLRLAGTPSAVSISNKRFTDFATRTATVTTSVYRGVAGVRGKLSGTWTWEAAFLWSMARGIDYEAGATRRSLLAAAINQSDPAKAFNPFTRSFAVRSGTLAVVGDYRNPASVLSTFQAPFVRNGITKLGSGDIRATGDLFRIWGGNTIAGAFGGEFRYEAYDDYRPPFAGLNPASSGLDPTNNDFLSFSPNADTHGNRHAAAAYAETMVPVVGREFARTLLQSLEFSASARYESYTRFGDTTKPKFGVSWKPAAWIMVRGSCNQSFRVPDLAQVYTGELIRSNTAADSYRNLVTQLPTDGVTKRRYIISGNRQLRPESGTGKSAGFVVEVPRLKGWSFSVDYWEIRQKDVFAQSGGIADDNAALQAATQAALAAGQRIDEIDLGSGTASYRGDPSVVRLTVTPADRDSFAAYNAGRVPGNQRAVVGAISLIRETFFNMSRRFVSGVDCNVHCRSVPTALGAFALNTSWTRQIAFFGYATANSRRLAGSGTYDASPAPLWRGSATLTWNRRQWGAGLGFYYVGRYTDPSATTTRATWVSLGSPTYIQPVFTNGAYSYRYVVHDTKTYNLFVAYRGSPRNRYLKDTTLRAQVKNLFNAEPPLVPGVSDGYETMLNIPMARGRTYSLELAKKL